jgi:Tfp pilus assembly protein PilN
MPREVVNGSLKPNVNPRQKIWMSHAVAWLACLVLMAVVWFFTLQSMDKERQQTEQAAQR